MSARKIIEARIGRKLPPAKDMAPDERKAVLRLGLHLARERAHTEMPADTHLNAILRRSGK